MRRMIVGMLLFLAGCAAAGAGSGGAARNLIERSEIQENAAANAYDLIQSERPQWLRLRQEQSLTDLVVYLDNARMGGRDALREIGLATVQYIRFVEPAAANLRWGMGHNHGAILISTLPQR